MTKQQSDYLNPIGEQLSEAIWDATWFAVNERQCSREDFIAMVTRAANEAFDSQLHNAALRKTAKEIERG